jgi:hypothetical protein
VIIWARLKPDFCANSLVSNKKRGHSGKPEWPKFREETPRKGSGTQKKIALPRRNNMPPHRTKNKPIKLLPRNISHAEIACPQMTPVNPKPLV